MISKSSFPQSMSFTILEAAVFIRSMHVVLFQRRHNHSWMKRYSQQLHNRYDILLDEYCLWVINEIGRPMKNINIPIPMNTLWNVNGGIATLNNGSRKRFIINHTTIPYNRPLIILCFWRNGMVGKIKT